MRLDRPDRRPLTVALWVLTAEIIAMLLWMSAVVQMG